MKRRDFFSQEMESNMLYMYDMLNEKQRRHFVALEALKLGPESYDYLSDLFGTHVKTIKAGIDDLEKKTK